MFETNSVAPWESLTREKPKITNRVMVFCQNLGHYRILTGVGIFGGQGKIRIGVRISPRLTSIFLIFTTVAVTITIDGSGIADHRISICTHPAHRCASLQQSTSLLVVFTGDWNPFVDLHRRLPYGDPFLFPPTDPVHGEHKLFYIVLLASPRFGPDTARHIGEGFFFGRDSYHNTQVMSVKREVRLARRRRKSMTRWSSLCSPSQDLKPASRKTLASTSFATELQFKHTSDGLSLPILFISHFSFGRIGECTTHKNGLREAFVNVFEKFRTLRVDFENMDDC